MRDTADCQHCAVLGTLQAGVILLDEAQRVTGWNDWLTRHSPITPAQVIGQRLSELVPELQRSRLGRAIDQAIQMRLSALLTPGLHPPVLPLYQNPIDLKAGRRMQQLIHVAPLGPGSAGCMIQVQDMTANVQREQRLRHNEGKLRGLYELSPLGIALTDMQGHYVEFNAAFERICGYTTDELQALDYWALTPREYEEQEEAQREQLARSGRYGPYEKEFIRKDGSRVPVQLNGMLVTGLGNEQYVWSIVEDITERRRIDRMKNEFVSTVSHELRTPLTSISGALGLLCGGALGEIPEAMRPWLDIALRNSQRLVFLVNDLLDMEKIAAGKMKYELQPNDLMSMVEQAVEANRAYGDQFDVSFSLDKRLDGARIRVDSQRFMQVLANFLSNAAKFSPQGGRVAIMVYQEGNQARVAVTDQGSGIPAEFRDRIFQKFSQADASDARQKGGTGLGLAITKELVEHMGGQVGFTSQEGQGSTFFVDFPLLDRQAA